VLLLLLLMMMTTTTMMTMMMWHSSDLKSMRNVNGAHWTPAAHFQWHIPGHVAGAGILALGNCLPNTVIFPRHRCSLAQSSRALASEPLTARAAPGHIIRCCVQQRAVSWLVNYSRQQPSPPLHSLSIFISPIPTGSNLFSFGIG
jgi:hypothetical protein